MSWLGRNWTRHNCLWARCRRVATGAPLPARPQSQSCSESSERRVGETARVLRRSRWLWWKGAGRLVFHERVSARMNLRYLLSVCCFFTTREQTGSLKECSILCGHPHLLAVAFREGKISPLTSELKNQPWVMGSLMKKQDKEASTCANPPARQPWLTLLPPLLCPPVWTRRGRSALSKELVSPVLVSWGQCFPCVSLALQVVYWVLCQC